MGAYDKDLPFLNVRKIARGKYGRVFDELGTFMDNVSEFEAKIKFDKKKVERANAFMDGNRVTGGSGAGKMKIHFTNAEFIKKVSQNPDAYYTFIGELEDPDPETTAANYQVVIKGVNFDEIPIHAFKVKDTIEIDVPFTFEDWEFL
ncbi:phage tail tube protein [Bacillus sp. CGMCC 1.16541]|uniref:phage tail tube protein n=1 Tax=Bacillus sp. CGMCC 1.16541 TaxID=2185143 RepID=UPI000D736092|nr:phage tail tube protein [Bacillus sp. CGMCC 1.16541]